VTKKTLRAGKTGVFILFSCVCVLICGCEEEERLERERAAAVLAEWNSMTLQPCSPSSPAEAARMQADTARALGIPAKRTIKMSEDPEWDYELIPEMTFHLIPAGTFYMGSPPTEEGHELDEWPLHRVAITKPFYMAEREVSDRQYRAVMRKALEGRDLPREGMNHTDAALFARRCGIEGCHFRLPTEAEWEYACRAGTQSPFYTGQTITADQANYNCRHIYGDSVAGKKFGHPVQGGVFAPNAFGLHDMYGNMYEWCSDAYDRDYYANSPIEDPQQASSSWRYVIRGGSWKSPPEDCRSAARECRIRGADNSYIGVRLVLDITVPPGS